MAKAGLSAIVWSGLSKTAAAIVLSPLVGFVLAHGAGRDRVMGLRCARRRSPSIALFRILQFVSASLYSLGHGGNDAQKTMGIIAVLLYSQGHLGGEFSVPFWVVLTCQAAMALGTLMGGWRIVRTMGCGITRLTPMQGFCAETGGAITLFMATALGDPGLDHAHDHRRHRRRRRRAARVGGALERGELDRLCLGDHRSRPRRSSRH